MKYFILAIVLCSALTSCYKMPPEDCWSTVPLTNNPHVIPQRSTGMMPSVSY